MFKKFLILLGCVCNFQLVVAFENTLRHHCWQIHQWLYLQVMFSASTASPSFRVSF